MTRYRGHTEGRLEDAFALFRLERVGNRAAPATLKHYDFHLPRFFSWLRANQPEVNDVDQVSVTHLRLYRAAEAERLNRFGRPISAETLHGSHRCLRAFFRWADLEGYDIDHRVLRLPKVRLPIKEADVFTITQLRKILAVCNPKYPQQELAIKILVGSGVRAAELAGLCAVAPDGQPDLMLDSMNRGRAELRIRWDAGAKDQKTRRVPITNKLATAIKRYETRFRPRVDDRALLISAHGRGYNHWGLQSVINRLERDCGFHIHMHAFRHTFATVATQMGWNFERLRAAMGHSDYQVLQRYVRLATDRNLGPRKDWADFILPPEEI